MIKHNLSKNYLFCYESSNTCRLYFMNECKTLNYRNHSEDMAKVMALLWHIILNFLTINYAYSKNITISAETLLPYDQGGEKWTNVFASYGESRSQYKEGNQGCALTLSLSKPQYDDICPLHELANLRKQVGVTKKFVTKLINDLK